MIEKKIHYCWLGGTPKPQCVIDCINSWKKYFPDYEIIEWNESNLDLNFSPYAKEAYQLKKWAFVTDVARLKIVYDNGGIYFDTDVEVLKPFGDILNQEYYLGLEDKARINTGVGFGAVKGNQTIKTMLDAYEGVHFIKEDGTTNFIVCPEYNTQALIKSGLIFSDGITKFRGGSIYPEEYFSPIGLLDGKKRLTNNTFSIHHFQNTWMTPRQRFKKKFMRRYGNKYMYPIWKVIKKLLGKS